MKELILSNTFAKALIDDEDYERCMLYNWNLGQNKVEAHYRSQENINLSNFVMQDSKSMYDHKNRNLFDNQKINLRIASKSQNQINRDKFHHGKSKYKGVSWESSRNKWRSTCGSIFLGRFNSEVRAAQAYNVKALEVYGEFAVLNIIEGDL